MIAAGDIQTILINKVKASNLGVDKVTKDKHAPVTKDANFERVVVNVLATKKGSWSEGFCNINIFVPDITIRGYPEPDNARLTELERKGIAIIGRGFTGSFEGSVYFFALDTSGKEEDSETFSHFINLRLTFQNI